jgi:hypothetical protein
VIKSAFGEERWIAPPDLVKQMEADLDIRYGKSFDFKLRNNPVISTIPMPSLMKFLDYSACVKFNATPGLNIRAIISDCDAYISLMVPDPKIPFSRVSITGNELIIELPMMEQSPTLVDLCLSVAADLLGIDPSKIVGSVLTHQKYAKITPINDAVRKNFMFHATDKFNIFSLGRFATWRPGLLMDDLVHDLRKINGWLNQGNYSIARER